VPKEDQSRPAHGDAAGYAGYADCEECVSEAAENQSLPTLETDLSPEEIRSRLLKLSKKGKLPGFEQDVSGALCAVAAHGAPFDSKLLIVHKGNALVFQCRMLPLMPRIFAVLLIVAVWPGLPLTETFLTSFDWYNSLLGSIGMKTWHWYLPLTILPTPLAFRGALLKSRSSAHESVLEQIKKISSVL
jgi:hypothetical protein